MSRASGLRFFFLFALVAFGCEILQASSPFVRNPLTSIQQSSMDASTDDDSPFDSEDADEPCLDFSGLYAIVPHPPQIFDLPPLTTTRRSVSCYPLSADLEQLKRPPRT
ncbi:MAG: hypothetical protein KF681_03480 [Bdellovibrionaceae bacterium]|nr:hypothetical protein [Pseudobdellovibrionaceae bacterium]